MVTAPQSPEATPNDLPQNGENGQRHQDLVTAAAYLHDELKCRSVDMQGGKAFYDD